MAATAEAHGVAVGTGVLVGGTGVAVDPPGVCVGTPVELGGTTVLDGATIVAVTVGGSGVLVRVGVAVTAPQGGAG